MIKRVAQSCLLLFIGCTMLTQAKGQAYAHLVLADKYFAAGDYFTAAGLYEQYLNPPAKEKSPSDFPLNSKKSRQGVAGSVSKLDIIFKQAESFRLANHWQEASARYEECFEKDPLKYAAGLYWYAVCQRSMGNYAGAEESVQLFLTTYAAGTPYRQAAEKELQTLQFIKTQMARPDSVLFRVQKINTSFGAEKGVYALTPAEGSGFFITSAQADSVVAEGVSPFHSRLMYATFTDGSLQNTEAVSMDGVDATMNQGTASLSASGNHLYFTQWKKENGKVQSGVYFSTKGENGWSKPALLPLVNKEGFSSKQPFCSADGKYLFFASNRTGGSGNFDIWYAPLRDDGTAGDPVNAGTALNTTEDEQAPFYHSASNTMVFSSNRKPGMGGYDLFTSKGQEKEWKTPENLGHPVNSSRDDVYFFASEKGTLLSNAIISSDRGADCCLESYAVSKSPKKKMITGIVRDCKTNEIIADAAVEMKDASGASLNTTTGADGKYVYELTGGLDERQLFITKEKYTDKTAGITVEGTNETDWLVDTLYTAALCMEQKLVIKAENVVSVYFDFNRSLVNERGMALLDSVYNMLVEDSTATIQISGYTDGLGSAEYNKILSDKRAKACADYLIQRGIDSTRLTFESFGACCPVEMELIDGRDNPDGRSKNRRALINISRN